MLNENTLELDAALRQTIQTVEHQRGSVDATKDEPLDQSLGTLLSELQAAMTCLRRNGLEAILFPLDNLTTSTVDYATLDETYLSLLQDSPWIISDALNHHREGTRYAALALVHDDESRWFSPDENHQQFAKADLVASLVACLNNPENFELVSGILSKLLALDGWRQEIENQMLAEYQKAAFLVLRKAPTMRRLEVYLQMWQTCRSHPGCELEIIGTMRGVTQGLKELGKRAHTVPYIPSSVSADIGRMQLAKGPSKEMVADLEASFHSLQEKKDA